MCWYIFRLIWYWKATCISHTLLWFFCVPFILFDWGIFCHLPMYCMFIQCQECSFCNLYLHVFENHKFVWYFIYWQVIMLQLFWYSQSSYLYMCFCILLEVFKLIDFDLLSFSYVFCGFFKASVVVLFLFKLYSDTIDLKGCFDLYV